MRSAKAKAKARADCHKRESLRTRAPPNIRHMLGASGETTNDEMLIKAKRMPTVVVEQPRAAATRGKKGTSIEKFRSDRAHALQQ